MEFMLVLMKFKINLLDFIIIIMSVHLFLIYLILLFKKY